MVLPKSKNAVGLGNSLMNDRFKSHNSNMHRASASGGSITRKDPHGDSYITPAKQEADWVKMRSVTEQSDLDEFLTTAALAGTDFTAEKMNSVKIIHRDQKNPFLLSRDEERGVVRKQNAKRARLTVPRRPPWDARTSKAELDVREREAFLDWRRGLAELQEVDDLLMTPFERNLEVWRQLWRVIERSDLIVQIVDARNPLLFRSEDLEKYVVEVGKGRKRNLLLVNKADMMTEAQRRAWAEWFVERGVRFRFFSAELAREMNEAREDEEGNEEDERSDGEEDEGEEEGVLDEDDVEEEIDLEDGDRIAQEAEKIDLQEQQEDEEEWVDEESIDPEPHPDRIRCDADFKPENLSIEEQTRILTTEDLEALFLEHSPSNLSSSGDDPNEQAKTTIGLVGYPNVGKSSTINALLGAKKVSVSATPGKTKHFQTIHLSSRVILCDCPGLVFPNFATTKAELVCNGILPIDQLREYTGPAALVAQRIPKEFLEAVYGIKIKVRSREEGGTGVPTAEEVLRAYARARGFWTQGLGQPDESRAARVVLKDYVKGKLLFVHPPPPLGDVPAGIDERGFNRELYDLSHLPTKHRSHLPSTNSASEAEPSLMDSSSSLPKDGPKGQSLDETFFAPGSGANGNIIQPFHYKYSQQGEGPGKQLSGRKLKVVRALEQDVDPADLKGKASKKHFKSGKRAKTAKGRPRGGVGGED